MLPWLFGVLLVLNVALFYLGHQREKSLEPELTPVSKGQYEIFLLSERASEGGTAQTPRPDMEGDTHSDPVDSTAEAAEGAGTIFAEPIDLDTSPASESVLGDIEVTASDSEPELRTGSAKEPELELEAGLEKEAGDGGSPAVLIATEESEAEVDDRGGQEVPAVAESLSVSAGAEELDAPSMDASPNDAADNAAGHQSPDELEVEAAESQTEGIDFIQGETSDPDSRRAQDRTTGIEAGFRIDRE